MNMHSRLLLLSLAPVGLYAQNAPSRVEFEVASIRPSAQTGTDRPSVGIKIDGAQVRCTYMALRDYIAMAYGVQYYQISGPDWIASQRFDITAKLPADSKPGQVPDMITALLANRFGMTAHKESKNLAVYALLRGKGELQLKESQAGPLETAGDSPSPGSLDVVAGGSPGGVAVNLGQGAAFSFANNRLEGRKISMNSLARVLARFLDRPAIDMTGLTKTYDFTLALSSEDFNAMMIRAALASGVVLPPQAMKALEYASGDSMFSALEAVGLKLDARKAPLEVIIIDHIEKTPSAN